MTLKEILTVVNEENVTIIMPNASVTRGRRNLVIKAPFTPDKEALTICEVYNDDGIVIELDFDYDYFVRNGGLD